MDKFDSGFVRVDSRERLGWGKGELVCHGPPFFGGATKQAEQMRWVAEGAEEVQEK